MSGKPAARVTDPTTCPIPGQALNGAFSATVFINGLQ